MFSSNTSQVSNDAVYVEDVFQTYLYTGNGTTQTINNGVSLSTKGGLVWIKGRNGTSLGNANHALQDSARGPTYTISSDLTNAQSNQSTGGVTAFNSNGFSIGDYPLFNDSGYNYASWTFRKQPKFFDVVTYTGNGTTQNISHNLGSTPGCVIVKVVSGTTGGWITWHRGLSSGNYIVLNSTNAQSSTNAHTYFGNGTTTVDPTSTQFTVGTSSAVNGNGFIYVAYIFAHNAGGFGLTGTDNVISCGSFTADGSGNATVNLGYEPQWILWKQTTGTAGWNLTDTMRGMSYSATAFLQPNSSGAESVSAGNYLKPTATGFQGDNGTFANSTPYIYIAIRRGPMKTPTSGTSVFAPVAYTGTGATLNITGASFPPDLSINQARVVGSGWGAAWYDRLRGPNNFIRSSAANAENTSYTDELTTFNMNGVTLGASANGVTNNSGQGYVDWLMRRAPGFFDVVCYTGTGSARTVAHNLCVAPELMILKARTDDGVNTQPWIVGWTGSSSFNDCLFLNSTAAWQSPIKDVFNNTRPTASVFSVGLDAATNYAGWNYVAYLFASCPGVSKVSSYTGTGATQTISCGFAARFVLIKRTDSTGGWFVWDTARGMVAGTDPRLALNSTAAETNANWVYTDASGFQIVTTDATVNASGGSYIYLAIA